MNTVKEVGQVQGSFRGEAKTTSLKERIIRPGGLGAPKVNLRNSPRVPLDGRTGPESALSWRGRVPAGSKP